MKKRLKYYALCVAMSSLLLSGCAKKSASVVEEAWESTSLQESSSVSEDSSSIAQEISPATRTFPTFDDVEKTLLANEQLTLGRTAFQTTQQIHHNQQQFDVSVNEMRVYIVKKHDATLASEFNFESQAGAVIVMNVTITNESDHAFYFPIEELRLSFEEATLNTSASTALYPDVSANLVHQLLEQEGKIEAHTSVEGYMIYGVGAQAYHKMIDEQYFYLTVVPPRATLETLIGAEGNPLGDTLNLFLPLNERVAQSLSQNSEYIQDRLTTEWWGDKEVLASKTLSQTQTQQQVDVTLKRLELSDFTPRELYEESFQNFIYGQMIVSIEYEVHNRSKESVLPIDGVATLTIGDDPIQSDYVLINQKYGQEVKPDETYRVIKTFALDKQRYIDYWQGKEIDIMIVVPHDDATYLSQNDTTTMPLEDVVNESSSDTPLESQDTTSTRTYIFQWRPRLTKEITTPSQTQN